MEVKVCVITNSRYQVLYTNTRVTVSLQEWNPSPSTKRLQDPLQVRRIDSLDPLDGSRGPQWERVVDPEGGVRFHNPSTGEVTQSPPSNMV